MQYFFFFTMQVLNIMLKLWKKTISTKLTIHYFIHDNPSNRYPHSQDKSSNSEKPYHKKAPRWNRTTTSSRFSYAKGLWQEKKVHTWIIASSWNFTLSSVLRLMAFHCGYFSLISWCSVSFHFIVNTKGCFPGGPCEKEKSLCYNSKFVPRKNQVDV